MRTIRTFVVGGSNTVINGGYLAQLGSACQDRGLDLQLVANAATGNTTIGYGLYQLKKNPVLAECDLLLIEYGINDEFAYSILGKSELLQHWGRLYEGVIRYAKSVNPTIEVVSLVMETRLGDYIRRIPPIASGVSYLSGYYGVGCLDVNRELVRKLGRETVSDPSFYMPGDDAHYARPHATGMIADLAADVLLRFLGQQQKAKQLPPPVDPQHFAAADCLDLVAFAQSQGLSATEYRNWQFFLNTVDLSPYQMRFNITDGRLLGIEYACEPRSAPFFISVNDRLVRVNGMKAGVADGTYKFLISNMPCEFLYEPKILQADEGTRSYTIAPRASQAPDANWTPRDGTQREAPEARAGLFLSSLLYSGKLTDLAFVPLATAGLAQSDA